MSISDYAWVRLRPSPRVVLMLSWLGVLSCMLLDQFIDNLFNYNFIETSLYLIPITVSTWYCGWRRGLLVALPALVGELSLSYVQISSRYPHVENLMPVLFVSEAGQMSIVLFVISRLRHYLESYHHFASVDELTGCLNARAFRHEGTLAIERLRRTKNPAPLSVLFIDVDDFKLVNDLHGHHAGDEALRLLGRTLRNTFRMIDTVGRIGGDEFAVLLPETTAEQVPLIMQRLRDALREAGFPTTLSIGATTYPPGVPQDLDDVLRRTDGLMYQDKRSRSATPPPART